MWKKLSVKSQWHTRVGTRFRSRHPNMRWNHRLKGLRRCRWRAHTNADEVPTSNYAVPRGESQVPRWYADISSTSSSTHVCIILEIFPAMFLPVLPSFFSVLFSQNCMGEIVTVNKNIRKISRINLKTNRLKSITFNIR